MVSAVTCAVEIITDGNIWFWLVADSLAPFFRRAGTSVHPRKCQRILKHQSKNWAILFFKHAEILDVNWDSNPISSRLCTWGIVKSD